MQKPLEEPSSVPAPIPKEVIEAYNKICLEAIGAPRPYHDKSDAISTDGIAQAKAAMAWDQKGVTETGKILKAYVTAVDNLYTGAPIDAKAVLALDERARKFLKSDITVEQNRSDAAEKSMSVYNSAAEESEKLTCATGVSDSPSLKEIIRQDNESKSTLARNSMVEREYKYVDVNLDRAGLALMDKIDQEVKKANPSRDDLRKYFQQASSLFLGLRDSLGADANSQEKRVIPSLEEDRRINKMLTEALKQVPNLYGSDK